MKAGTSRGDSYTERKDGENSQTTMEIKIKTLDSQVYTCRVEQHVPVSALKEKIASLTGVPVENQRLICHGKVLKDDHLLSAYSVEDGHTLHLVTRQGNPSSTSARVDSSGVVADETESHPAATNSRIGQVSHSVVLGTFNNPDHADGGMPDVSRIIGSVLNSLGMGNLLPGNTGTSNDGSIAATILPTHIQQSPVIDTQGTTEAGGGRLRTGVNTGSQIATTDQSGLRVMGPHFDSVQGLQSSSSFVGALPVAVPQVPAVIQQAMVVPDALTTLSQYLNRMEQVFATNGQQISQAPSTFLNSSTQTQSPSTSQLTDGHTIARGIPTPAILGSIVRGTQELLSNRAGPELLRLASLLESEPNLNDATVRGEVQSAALRDGIILQHLGALILELGRATLTLRMGSSPTESAVNAGPAVFISASGPNPMMVQPLPFQPGTGLGAFTGVTTPPTAGVMGPSVGATVIPRNINIHIHAGELGLPSSAQSTSAMPQAAQSSGMTPGAILGSSITESRGHGQIADASNRDRVGNNIPLGQAVQGTTGDNGAVRVVPIRTLVAAVPASVHSHPATDAAGATVGVFYPLLARFQQLSPAQFSPQTGSPQATLINERSAGQPRASGTAVVEQEQFSVSAPPQTVVSQVQLQAWMPSGGQIDPMSSGQMSLSQQFPITVASGTGSVNDMIQAATSIQSANNDQARIGILRGINLAGLVRPLLQQLVEAYQQTGAVRPDQAQPQEVLRPNEHEGVASGAGVCTREQVTHEPQEPRSQTALNIEQSTEPSEASTEMSQCLTVDLAPSNLTDPSSSAELDKTNGKMQSNGAPDVPVGLGLGGLHPLPTRSQKRPHKPNRRQQASGTSGHRDEDQITHSLTGKDQPREAGNRGLNVLQDLLSSLASQADETSVVGTESGQISQGVSQFINSVSNIGHSFSGENINLGEVMSQLMLNSSTGNLLQATRGADEGASLPSGALESIMGQLTQNPLIRNVVEQVMEQVGDEPQDFERMLSQGLNSQGGIDLSGMLQQMMPIVSRALFGSSGGGSDHASIPAHDTELSLMEDVEGIGDVGSLDGLERPKQVVNQLFGSDSQTISTDNDQQQSTQAQRPASEGYSGGAPVAKRQKMDLEETFRKLEQGGTPEDIVRSVAETAANVMTSSHNTGAVGSNFAQQLSQTEGIADEYMALLLRDLATQIRAGQV